MRRPGRAFAFAALALAAGIPLGASAQGGSMPSYEPQQRLRTALDTCMKNEVMRNAVCLRKCESGFRMDFAGPRPRCVGLKADAKYTPPKPAYRPPAPNPNWKAPAGGMG